MMASLVTQTVKGKDVADVDSIPELGRSAREGNDKPLQYLCLGNLMDRGSSWSIIHGVSRVGHNLATKPPTTTKGKIGYSSMFVLDKCMVKDCSSHVKKNKYTPRGFIQFIMVIFSYCLSCL